MIRKELPKPNHKFKDEVGKMPDFRQGGIICGRLNGNESIITQRHIIAPFWLEQLSKWDAKEFASLMNELKIIKK